MIERAKWITKDEVVVENKTSVIIFSQKGKIRIMAGSEDLAQAEKLYEDGKKAICTDKSEAKKILKQALELFNKCIQAQGSSYGVPLSPDVFQKKKEIEGILNKE